MNVQVAPLAAASEVKPHLFAASEPDELPSMPEEAMITFPDGLIGCEDWRRFVLLETETSGALNLLQSLDDPQVSFVVVDPYILLPDYSFEMTEADVRTIGLDDPAHALVVCILTVKQQPAFSVTANLLGPLVINVKSRRGVQVILAQSGYSARFPVPGSSNGNGS